MPMLAPPSLGTSPAFRYEDRAKRVRVYQVNTDQWGRNIIGDAANEPSIAIDPTAPNRVVIGWRQFDTVLSDFRQGGYGYSRDGGRTWSGGRVHQPGHFRSDPVLSSGRDGTIVYTSLCVDDCGPGYINGTFITSDGGLSWTGPHFAYGGDKAWFALANNDGAPDGFGFQAWSPSGNQWDPGLWSRSFDSGATWSAPLTYAPSDREIQWGKVALGPAGEVYVSGIELSFVRELFIARSADAAQPGVTSPSFSFARIPIAPTYPLYLRPPNPGGLLGQIELAVDTSEGGGRGNVYMLVPTGKDWRNGRYDLTFFRSTDGGVTWDEPRPISPPVTHDDVYNWFGTLGIAPNGRLDVVWNTNLQNPGQVNITRTYYMSSSDAGETWTAPVPLGPLWDSHLGWPVQRKIGDYYDMVSDNVGVSVAFAATFKGEQDVYHARIGDWDCNGNDVGDETDLDDGTSEDCNDNAIPDECELAAGTLTDVDSSGVPDQCECPPDLTTTGSVAGEAGYGLPDRILDSADVSYFVQLWLDGVPSADVTTQNAPIDHWRYGSPDGVVTGVDLMYYVNFWVGGCQ